MIEKQPPQLQMLARLMSLELLLIATLKTMPGRASILANAESTLAREVAINKGLPNLSAEARIIMEGALEALASIRAEIARIDLN